MQGHTQVEKGARIDTNNQTRGQIDKETDIQADRQNRKCHDKEKEKNRLTGSHYGR